MPARTDDRHALAEFLRLRRERLPPVMAGITESRRRRTPGLRREEVAQLAGMGVTWYTWLEQGRDIGVSTQALDRLAQALQLDVAERAHLFALARHPAPDMPKPMPTRITPALTRVIEGMPYPAYVKNARWDMIARNAPAAALFGDLMPDMPPRCNVLWQVFTSPRCRALMPDWEDDAASVVARFRANHARHAEHPEFQHLVEALSEASGDFRRFWQRHDVRAPGEGVKRFRVPDRGVVTFDHLAMQVLGEEDLRLVAYLARE